MVQMWVRWRSGVSPPVTEPQGRARVEFTVGDGKYIALHLPAQIWMSIARELTSQSMPTLPLGPFFWVLPGLYISFPVYVHKLTPTYGQICADHFLTTL